MCFVSQIHKLFKNFVMYAKKLTVSLQKGSISSTATNLIFLPPRGRCPEGADEEHGQKPSIFSGVYTSSDA